MNFENFAGVLRNVVSNEAPHASEVFNLLSAQQIEQIVRRVSEPASRKIEAPHVSELGPSDDIWTHIPVVLAIIKGTVELAKILAGLPKTKGTPSMSTDKSREILRNALREAGVEEVKAEELSAKYASQIVTSLDEPHSRP